MVAAVRLIEPPQPLLRCGARGRSTLPRVRFFRASTVRRNASGADARVQSLLAVSQAARSIGLRCHRPCAGDRRRPRLRHAGGTTRCRPVRRRRRAGCLGSRVRRCRAEADRTPVNVCWSCCPGPRWHLVDLTSSPATRGATPVKSGYTSGPLPADLEEPTTTLGGRTRR